MKDLWPSAGYRNPCQGIRKLIFQNSVKSPPVRSGVRSRNLNLIDACDLRKRVNRIYIGRLLLEKSSRCQKRSKTQILTLSDPKIRGQDPKTLSKRAHNPLLKEAGLTKPTGAHPSGGPGGWGGDWYVWHAPDGPRARAATGLECMQAGAEKLGVIEASYASAIIGVLSPVSSHC